MVEPIRMSRKAWSAFLEAVEFYADTDEEERAYLLQRAVEGRKRENGKWVLYPITEAEREVILDATQEFLEIEEGL